MNRFNAPTAMREIGFLDFGDGSTAGLDRLLDTLGVDPAVAGSTTAAETRLDLAHRMCLFEVVSLVVPIESHEDQEWICRLHAATTASDDALIAALAHPNTELRRLAACTVAYTRGTGPAVLDAIRARLEYERDAPVRLQLLIALGGRASEGGTGRGRADESVDAGVAVHADLSRRIGAENDSVTRLGAALGLLRVIGGDRATEPEVGLPPYVRPEPHNVADEEVDDDLIDALAECLGPGGMALYRLPALLEWGHPLNVVVEHWALGPRTRARLLTALLARLAADPDLDPRAVVRMAREACVRGIEGAGPLATALADLLAHGDPDLAKAGAEALRHLARARDDLPPGVERSLRRRMADALAVPSLAGHTALVLARWGDERCLPVLVERLGNGTLPPDPNGRGHRDLTAALRGMRGHAAPLLAPLQARLAASRDRSELRALLDGAAHWDIPGPLPELADLLGRYGDGPVLDIEDGLLVLGAAELARRMGPAALDCAGPLRLLARRGAHQYRFGEKLEEAAEVVSRGIAG